MPLARQRCLVAATRAAWFYHRIELEPWFGQPLRLNSSANTTLSAAANTDSGGQG